jgi:hypothetical protein
MVKPICFIKYNPEEISGAGGMKVDVSTMNKVFQDKLNDYHVIAIPSGNIEEVINLTVYNAENFTDVEYAELKLLIETSVENLKLNNNA